MDAAHAYWLPVPKAQKTTAASRGKTARVAAAIENDSLPVR
jgi:hypothetical protein